MNSEGAAMEAADAHELQGIGQRVFHRKAKRWGNGEGVGGRLGKDSKG